MLKFRQGKNGHKHFLPCESRKIKFMCFFFNEKSKITQYTNKVHTVKNTKMKTDSCRVS